MMQFHTLLKKQHSDFHMSFAGLSQMQVLHLKHGFKPARALVSDVDQLSPNA